MPTELMSTDELLDELCEYYGEYRNARQREVTVQYITKRYRQKDYPLLRKYLYEYHPVNYGPPIVSNLRTVETKAWAEGHTFTKPYRERGTPMYKCGKCGKKIRMEEMKCPYCQHYAGGTGMLILPQGYFD